MMFACGLFTELMPCWLVQKHLWVAANLRLGKSDFSFCQLWNLRNSPKKQHKGDPITRLPAETDKVFECGAVWGACQLVVGTLIYCQWRTHKRKGEANLNAHGKRWNFYLPEEYGPIKNETENEVQLERVKLTGRWRDNLFVFWVG